MAKNLTDEQFKNELDEIDRISKMTPDEAYRNSVESIGRADGIADEMHAAAATPAPTAAQPKQPPQTQTPTTAPTAPVAAPGQPSRTVVGADGKGRTTYGGYVRVVDQKTGDVTWEDTNGNAVDAPKSMQMMEAANAGFSPNQGTAKSWDDAIAQQNAQRMQGFKTRSQQRYDFMRKSIEERRRMRAERDFTTAEAAKNALKLLNEGEGEIKTHKATGKKYRVVTIGGSAIDQAREQTEKMGKFLSLQKIAAYQQVDDDGRPVAGTQPAFFIKVGKNNGDGAKDSSSLKPLSLGTVMNQYAKTFGQLNKLSDQEAQSNAVSDFGGLNPLGWKISETPASVQAAQVRAEGMKDVQKLKNEGAAAVAEQKGKSSEEIARINGEYRKQVADIETRTKSSVQTNGKITGTDIAALLKVASDPLASEDVRQKAIGTASLLQDRLNGIAEEEIAATGDKSPIKPGDNNGDDNAQSADYPGYTNGKAKRALAAGWKWDADKQRFVKP